MGQTTRLIGTMDHPSDRFDVAVSNSDGVQPEPHVNENHGAAQLLPRLNMEDGL